MNTKALRQKMLDLAIRGKLVPQDPNDEPASVLLDKIRAEKQQMVKEGKLRAKDIKNDTIIYKDKDNLHYEKFQDGTVKCIENEIPFEVPERWSWCRLTSISKEIFAGGDKPEDVQKDPDSTHTIPIFSNGIENDGLYGYTSKSRVCKPALTVSARGTIGYTCIRTSPFVPIIRLIVIIPQEEISMEYLQIVFNSLLVKSEGSSIPQLTVPIITPKLIPLPPKNEQKRIAFFVTNVLDIIKYIDEEKKNICNIISVTKSKVLDLAIRGKLVPQDPNDEPASVLLERIRKKKEELIKQGKIKRDKKESIIYRGDDNFYYEKIGDEIRCIEEELPFKLPDNWMWCSLSNISDIIMGSSPNGKNICEDPNFLEFHQGKIYFSDHIISCSNQYTKEVTKIAVPNSVLLCVRAPVGEINLTDRPICIGRGLAAIKPYDFISEQFLFYWLQAFKSTLVSKATGTTFIAITTDVVKRLMIPIPPLKEQIYILNQINLVLDKMKEIEKSLS